MGKYLEAIGVWKHIIGDIEHRIKPDMLDNERVNRIIHSCRGKDKQGDLVEKIGDYYFDLVVKSYPEMSDSDKIELKQWIRLNQYQILEDVQISHRIISQEDLNKLKEKALNDEDAIKKLTRADD